MRYELRRWTNAERTEYVVRQTSNDLEAIKAQLNRTLSHSSEPSMNYIVDTEEEND